MPFPGTRAMVFVDGTNLLVEVFSALGVKLRAEKASADALNLASQCVAHSLRELFGTHMQGHIIVRRYWFGSVQGSEEDLETAQMTLRSLGYDAAVFRNVKGRDAKGVDLAVAREMLIHGFQRNYDVAIVVAGDEDYLGLVQDVKRFGLIVVGMYFESSALSKKLKVAFDHFSPLYNPEPFQPVLTDRVKAEQSAG